MLIANGLKRN